MTSPHSQNLTPAPSTPPAESTPKRKGWAGIGLFVGITLLGFLVGLGLGAFSFVDWAGGWTWSDVDMSVAAQPLATILSASGVILAARIALHNGEANRKNERKMQQQTAKRDTERTLRDRFFKITETLAESSNYVKREAGVYALVALADDWAVFHRDNPDAAKREQQTCLNVIAGQLRDPLSITSSSLDHKPSPVKGAQRNGEQSQHDPALLTFKHRVQDIIWERFRPSDERETGVWSHLTLDLSNCHLHEMSTGRVIVHGEALFTSADFHGITSFDSASFNRASFNRAKFHGFISFEETKFHDEASFSGVSFDSASFNRVHFRGVASFDRAKFHEAVSFNRAKFEGSASFTSVKFESIAWFSSTKFHSEAWFNFATFENISFFERTKFHNEASFYSVSFYSASFNRVYFHGRASFDSAEFEDSASFDGVYFHGLASFDRAWFHPAESSSSARFNHAHFCGIFTWREFDGDESQIDFREARFRADKATVLQVNDGDVPGKVFDDAIFSASCSFDSAGTPEQVEKRP